jgi:glycerol-3-phosphate dehydrogenase
MADYDLAIIGGGINGTAVARDAAGRGLRVLLVEQGDLAAGTSSASTKLIHGGLRYLEHGALRLVREGLREREVMLRMAPHIVWPTRFVLPHHAGLRPAWQLRAGLFLYDHLGGRELLPATRTVPLTLGALGVPLKREFRFGFEYSDCCVDDSRLVVLNAVDAAEHGAMIRTRTRCARVDRRDTEWRLVLNIRGEREEASARVLVNASGPWIDQVNETVLRLPAPVRLRLVKGSHIVLPRLFDHDRAYIFQNADRRIVFAIPYQDDFTLVGTTDHDFRGEPGAVAAQPHEITYLCRAVSEYFRAPVGPEQVVWAFAGVRSLPDDPAAKAKDLSRDYLIRIDGGARLPPLVSIYGGKITTARRLAEEALARLTPMFQLPPPWTARAPLPGGDFPHDGFAALVNRARGLWPFLTGPQARRLVRAYGTRIDRVLGGASRRDDLGPSLGADLTAAEVHYLVCHEWAETGDDVMWRRSKLGLRLTADERAALSAFVDRARIARQGKRIVNAGAPSHPAGHRPEGLPQGQGGNFVRRS